MADSTSPKPPGAPDPGPRRIRSLPPPVRGSSLLIASASGHSEDANWRRGVTILWILFGSIALAEMTSMAFHALGGYEITAAPSDIIRLMLIGGVFFSLWIGWNWTRWVLAVFAFLFGLAELMQLLRLTDEALRLGGGQTLPGHSLLNMPTVAAGMLYLGLAGYLAFSSDVSAFTKHRREEGRKWVLLPVVLVLGAYLAIMIAFPLLYAFRVQTQRASAAQFGEETLRAFAAHWDPAVFATQGSERLLAVYPFAERARMMSELVPLGPFQDARQHADRIVSDFDWREQRFVLRTRYNAAARFAHGEASISMALIRSPFGPWRMDVISVDNVSKDAPPAPPSPAAGPEPMPSPSA